MSAATWNVLGLLGALAGVLLLFRYGMPYTVRTGGIVGIAIEQEDEEAKKKEARYNRLGWIGLSLIIAGVAGQIIASTCQSWSMVCQV